MRILLIFILSLNLQFVHASDYNYDELRSLYIYASNDEVECQKLLKLTEGSELEEDIIAYSYHGVSKMLNSKFSLNPFFKFSEFNTGKDMLEEAISLEPNNLELRFLRYCVQINTPKFLNYKANLDADSLFISNQLESNVELKSFINPIFNAL
ncbi:MAG: hypothetical protein ISR00_02685 [Flavobacteriales bacterium]|nr:hypothetical protein [Flavobacteriales bacterium]